MTHDKYFVFLGLFLGHFQLQKVEESPQLLFSFFFTFNQNIFVFVFVLFVTMEQVGSSHHFPLLSTQEKVLWKHPVADEISFFFYTNFVFCLLLLIQSLVFVDSFDFE